MNAFTNLTVKQISSAKRMNAMMPVGFGNTILPGYKNPKKEIFPTIFLVRHLRVVFFFP